MIVMITITSHKLSISESEFMVVVWFLARQVIAATLLYLNAKTKSPNIDIGHAATLNV